ncbi:MAG: septation protein IspZ [Gammaproteobacteria bacterium]|nr:septation protein IspZ [Gammaproteobacteria bacterium]MCY4323691.1 septation protein IspZ [Gammaproteobacteria bacterium]
MKQFEDLLPLVVFGVAYYLADIYIATAALMVAFVLTIVWKKLRGEEVSKTLKLSLAAVLVLGGLTLLLRSNAFILFKPTLVWWVMGGALALSQIIGRENLMEKLLGSHIQLSADVWRTLNLWWASIFFLLGAANIYIAMSFVESTWVAWKLASGFGVVPLLVIISVFWLYRRGAIKDEQAASASGSGS